MRVCSIDLVRRRAEAGGDVYRPEIQESAGRLLPEGETEARAVVGTWLDEFMELRFRSMEGILEWAGVISRCFWISVRGKSTGSLA
jgi:hypothetical protein